MTIRIWILSAALACTEAFALSPPWITLQKKIASTVGKDPSVQVDALDTSSMPYVVNIRVSDSAKANALASVLIPRQEMGGVTVVVRVQGATPSVPATGAEMAATLRTAFESNPLFVAAYEVTARTRRVAAATFAKSLVQFYNDDGSDVYGNYNETAVRTFKDIVTNDLVWFGTAPFATVNAGSYRPAVVASNTILSIMGQEIACSAGLQVFVGDVRAEVLYQSSSMVNFVTPSSAAEAASVPVRAMCGRTYLGATTLNSAETDPALFTTAQDGEGQASALNAAGSQNGQDAPAWRNSVVTLYGTGFGRVKPTDSDGVSRVAVTVTATLGNQPVEVVEASAVPGKSGVQQIKVRIPANATPGPAITIQLQAGGRSTQSGTTIAVN